MRFSGFGKLLPDICEEFWSYCSVFGAVNKEGFFFLESRSSRSVRGFKKDLMWKLQCWYYLSLINCLWWRHIWIWYWSSVNAKEPPKSFYKLTFKGKAMNLSIYEKELLVVVFVVHKWRHYLLNDHFLSRLIREAWSICWDNFLIHQFSNNGYLNSLCLTMKYSKQVKDNTLTDALSKWRGRKCCLWRCQC